MIDPGWVVHSRKIIRPRAHLGELCGSAGRRGVSEASTAWEMRSWQLGILHPGGQDLKGVKAGWRLVQRRQAQELSASVETARGAAQRKTPLISR